MLVVCMRGKCSTKCTKGGCGNYDVTPYIFLILSLIFPPNAPGGRRRFARCSVEMGDCRPRRRA